jgi:hypothetical protein
MALNQLSQAMILAVIIQYKEITYWNRKKKAPKLQNRQKILANNRSSTILYSLLFAGKRCREENYSWITINFDVYSSSTVLVLGTNVTNKYLFDLHTACSHCLSRKKQKNKIKFWVSKSRIPNITSEMELEKGTISCVPYWNQMTTLFKNRLTHTKYEIPQLHHIRWQNQRREERRDRNHSKRCNWLYWIP